MRNLIFVILCGVAVVSLLPRPGDAHVDIPEKLVNSSSQHQPVDGDEKNGKSSTIFSDDENNLEELDHLIDEEDYRRFGGGKGQGSKSKRRGESIKDSRASKYDRMSKNSNDKKKKTNRQKVQRRKSHNANRPSSYLNEKNQQGKDIIYKKKVNRGTKDRIVRDKERVSLENPVVKGDQVVAKDDAPRNLRKKKKRCRPKKSCNDVSGSCKKNCNKKKELPSRSGICIGKRCVCCVKRTKKPTACKQKGTCVAKGTCRKICKKVETPATYLPCAGKKCICCLSPNTALCGQNPECQRAGGTCKPKCDGERVVAGICKGPHCSCCIPPIPCSNTRSCVMSGGRCKSVCLNTEVRLPGTCGQGGCFCCGPPNTQCTLTPNCPGTCSMSCKGVVSLEAQCLGASCLCCLDCSPTSACTDANGVCKSLCGCGEKELRGGCKGGGCKCCVADVLDCKSGKSSSCPNCKFTPLCTGSTKPLQQCGLKKGCSCC